MISRSTSRGSAFFAWAISSMKLPMAKAWWMLLTERSHPTRTWARASPLSARTLGIASGQSSTPCWSSPSSAWVTPGAKSAPIDGNAVRCSQPVTFPPASRLAIRRCALTVWK
jgi:hypothetical protein